MQMTPSEILADYSQAKNQKRQIRILADLNSCGVDEIIQVLTDNGAKVDKRWYHSGRKKSQPAVADALTESEQDVIRQALSAHKDALLLKIEQKKGERTQLSQELEQLKNRLAEVERLEKKLLVQGGETDEPVEV